MGSVLTSSAAVAVVVVVAVLQMDTRPSKPRITVKNNLKPWKRKIEVKRDELVAAQVNGDIVKVNIMNVSKVLKSLDAEVQSKVRILFIQ